MKVEVERNGDGNAEFKIVAETQSDALAMRIMEDAFEKDKGKVSFDWEGGPDGGNFVCYIVEKGV